MRTDDSPGSKTGDTIPELDVVAVPTTEASSIVVLSLPGKHMK
jgi:hypothetical protein